MGWVPRRRRAASDRPSSLVRPARVHRNPFDDVLEQIDRAADVLHPDADALAPLRHPKRQVIVSLPVMMDDGHLKVFEGYRVMYDNSRGPGKGWHSLPPRRQSRRLQGPSSMDGLEVRHRRHPVWRRQGWRRVRSVEDVGWRARARHTPLHLGDLRTDWADCRHPGARRRHQPARHGLGHGHVLHEEGLRRTRRGNGKPIPLGGSTGRLEATGRGLLFITRETLKRVERDLPDSTVAIQGFGNVGSNAARLLHAAGARVVAVSDVSGAIYDPRGLDVPRVLAYYSETGQVRGFPGTTLLDNEQLLRLPVDVLLPAAMEGQITAENASEVHARIIVEGANGPTTPEADEILTQRGTLVVPDILANAGGVVVSYFEWVQDRYGYFWKEAEVNERLEEKMVAAFDAVWHNRERFEVDARTAAYILAVDRIIEARTLRGLYA